MMGLRSDEKMGQRGITKKANGTWKIQVEKDRMYEHLKGIGADEKNHL